MEADISLHSLLHDQETNDHVCFKASPDFVKECVNIIFGKDNDMFENCDDHQHKTKLEETIESLNKDKNAHVNDFPKVVHYCTDENLFNRLKKELEKSSIEIDEEAKKEEELMCYIMVLESLVDALTPGYFPTRDFIKMRKTLCPDWVDQLDQIDKKTDPALNYCV